MEGLDELEGMAAAVDQELRPENFDPAAPEGPAEPAGPDYDAAAKDCVEIFAGLVCGVAPDAAAIWTAEAKERCAGALRPVLEKYGFTLGAMPVEMILLIVAGPLLWQSARAVAAAHAAAKEAVERAQASARGGDMAGRAAPGPSVPEKPEVHAQMALYGAK